MSFNQFARIATLAGIATSLVACQNTPTTEQNPATQTTPGTAPTASTDKPVTLNGAGATFPQPLYEKYSKEIKKEHPGIKINYQGIGSGGGIKQTIAGTVDFGASDAAMTDEEMAKVKGGVLLVPTAGGAVSVAHNVTGVKDLKLSNKVLTGIFSGKIAKWNDPQIAADNKGATLPDTAIKPVVRADGSGTSFIFSTYLSGLTPEFKTQVGASKEPKWPTSFLKGKGNPGVAGLIKQTPGSIGYVEYDFATKNGLASAQLQNGKGEFVAPSLETANQALADVKFPENFRTFDIKSTQGYPIVGLTWLLIPKAQKNPETAAAIKTMVKWALTSGQKINSELNYTSIPSATAQKAIAAVEAGVK